MPGPLDTPGLPQPAKPAGGGLGAAAGKPLSIAPTPFRTLGDYRTNPVPGERTVHTPGKPGIESVNMPVPGWTPPANNPGLTPPTAGSEHRFDVYRNFEATGSEGPARSLGYPVSGSVAGQPGMFGAGEGYPLTGLRHLTGFGRGIPGLLGSSSGPTINGVPAGGPPKPGPEVPGALKQSSSTEREHPVTAEEQVMIEKVAAPAFFAKVAAVTGVTPHDAASADELRLLGDKVVAGVQRYQAKLAAAQAAQQDRLIKAAAAAAGVLRTPQPAPEPAVNFLADAEVQAAALGMLAKRAAELEAAKAPAEAPKAEPAAEAK